MNKSYYIPHIQELAQTVSEGQTGRFLCPVCEGGSDSEKTLTVTRRSSTEAFYNCFRAKCGLGGGHIAIFEGVDGALLRPKSKKPTKHNPVHNLAGLDKEVVAFFGERFHITPALLAYARFQTTFDRRIYMPMFDTNRLKRGGVVRKYKELYQGRREYASIPKAMTHYLPKSDEIALSWYYKKRHRRKNSDTLLIVEDIPSALRLVDHVDAVSLLGTALGDDKQKEIRRLMYDRIYIALDEDATDKAIRIKKQCSLYLPSLSVLPLETDIKDMTPEQVEEKLHVCNIV